MLKVKEVFISLILIVLVSIYSKKFIVETRHKTYLVKMKENSPASESSVLHNHTLRPARKRGLRRRIQLGNDYLDYSDYQDYTEENGVQPGDYFDDLYVDEDFDWSLVNFTSLYEG